MEGPAAFARDIAIIVLCLESIVAIGIFIVIGILLLRLVRTLSRETRPILQTTGRTVNTVAGTADFVSRLVVTPLMRVLTAASAARRFVQVLVGGSRRRRE